RPPCQSMPTSSRHTSSRDSPSTSVRAATSSSPTRCARTMARCAARRCEPRGSPASPEPAPRPMPADTMRRGDLQHLQLERLRVQVARAAERVSLYRERLRHAGVSAADVRSLEDVRRLPFTTKSDFRDTYPFGLLAVPMQDVVRIHASSGTTGKPTVVAYTRGDLELWTELMARALRIGGVGPSDVVHNAYGYGLFTGGLGFHYGAERVGAAVIPLSGGFTDRQLTALRDFGSTVLCCTPSYALHLAEAIEEAGLPTAQLALRV